MKLTIKEPCNESWNDMPKMNETFKFCGVCDKNIYDFSSMSKTEVFATILTAENPICGRIAKKQMQLTADDVPALMSTLQQPRFRAKAFMVLAIVCSQLLASCENEKTFDGTRAGLEKSMSNMKKGGNGHQYSIGKMEVDGKDNKLKTGKKPPIVEEHNQVIFLPPPPPLPSVDRAYIPDDTEFTLGEPVSSDEYLKPTTEKVEDEENEVLTYAEVMPEFPGGTEKLMLFMKERIVYPPIAKDDGVEGNVYIRFTVASDGALSDFEIMKSPDHYLSQEALRVVKSMPKWMPGENHGKKVAVKTVVPIRFKLN